MATTSNETGMENQTVDIDTDTKIEIDGSAIKRRKKYTIIGTIITVILLTVILIAVITIITNSNNTSDSSSSTISTTSTSTSSFTTTSLDEFGVNIYSTDQTFSTSMLTTLINTEKVYNFRSFADWGRTSAVTNILNTYASSGTSLLLNIGWSESCSTYASLFTGYNFDIKVQIDSCGWPECWNPSEGGFCQGDMVNGVSSYVSKLATCDSVLSTDVEFVIPWQNAYAAAECDYGTVLQKARDIQESNGRRFSLSGTFYNFFHGPNLGAGVFPTSNINSLYTSVQGQASAYASGLELGLRVVETGWPSQCDSGSDKGYGAASTWAMCNYYDEAREYSTGNDVIMYWWIIDSRNVGDGCGYGAWGLFDNSGNFKC